MSANYFGVGEFTANKVTADSLVGNLILNRTTVKTSNYTILSSDCIVPFDTSGGSFIITLPLASSIAVGQHFIIKDEAGSASTNSLTISRSGSNTINGKTSIVISTDYNSVTLYSNGINYYIH